MEFEWHKQKRAYNIIKHKIDFVLAAQVFLDIDRIEYIDDRKEYGEVRYRTIGIAKRLILFVVYTKRGEKTRIISARRANRDERVQYLQAN